MLSKSAKKSVFLIVFCLIFLSASSISVKAQSDKELGEAFLKFVDLYKKQNFSEALPHAEILVKAIPDNANLQYMYGICLLGKSKNTKDKEEAKRLVARARQALVKSKELGNTDNLVTALIASLPEDGVLSGKFSKNEEAEKAMNEAEGFFTQGKFDEALALYQKALKLDPNIYEAALFSGDCYTQKGDFANAEIFYQKAIAINPNRETAYRYSATPLMKQKKYDEARARYIEAYITEPYSRFATNGITDWGKVTNTLLGHPKVDIPELKFDDKGQAIFAAPGETPNLNGDWKGYLATRIDWQKNKFAKTFPNEKTYRHTLQEEIEAIRNTLKSAKEQNLSNPQFDILQKLDNEGLLESYILLAHPDNGIARDHEAYLKTNRAKLRQYVLNYVIQK